MEEVERMTAMVAGVHLGDAGSGSSAQHVQYREKLNEWELPTMGKPNLPRGRFAQGQVRARGGGSRTSRVNGMHAPD